MKKIRSYRIETFNGVERWPSELELFEVGHSIQLIYRSSKTCLSAKHNYYFFALAEIRRKLEGVNCLLLCNGSRIDVYPSGMSAIGTLAYEIIYGKRASKLVEIFETPRSSSQIATVVEQRNYWLGWLRSVSTSHS